MNEKLTGGEIPLEGIAHDKIFSHMENLRGDDCNYRDGKTFSMVYHLGGRHEELMKTVVSSYLEENYLNPMAFQSIRKMEQELVTIVSDMLHGDSQIVGAATSGGTESILLACKTYRDRWNKKSFFGRPEMILAESAHVAFEKAAHYFGIKIKRLPLDNGYKADLTKLEKMINRKTCMVVLSAPQYPHGRIDPIVNAAIITKRKKVPLHVDACLGGFVLPWMEKLGEDIPNWDFRVDGVTSISLDVHKYGYCPKGASLIMYKNMDYMQDQFFISTEWPGGIYASPTLAGSRPGAAIAAAYASVVSLGESGFMRETKKIIEAKKKFLDGLNAIPALEVLGAPEGTCFAIVSKDPKIGIFAIGDQLAENNWYFDRQHKPQALHFTIMPAHLEQIPNLLYALKDAVETVKENPKLSDTALSTLESADIKVPFGAKLFLNIFGRKDK